MVETLAPLAVFSRLARILVVPSMALMLVGFYLLLGFAPYQYSMLFVWFIPFDRLFRKCESKEVEDSDPVEEPQQLPAAA